MFQLSQQTELNSMDSFQFLSTAELNTAFYSIARLLLTGCSLVGICVFIYGLFILKKHPENPQNYSIGKAVRNLVAGSALLVPHSMFSIFQNSLFTAQTSSNFQIFDRLDGSQSSFGDSSFSELIPDEVAMIIIGFLFIAGAYSFFKGLYLTRSIGIQGDDGQIVTVKKVFNHIFFGVIAMNIVEVANIVTSSFLR